MTAVDDLARNAARPLALGERLLRMPRAAPAMPAWPDPQAQLESLLAASRPAGGPEPRPGPSMRRVPGATADPWGMREANAASPPPARPGGQARTSEPAWAASLPAAPAEAVAPAARRGRPPRPETLSADALDALTPSRPAADATARARVVVRRADTVPALASRSDGPAAEARSAADSMSPATPAPDASRSPAPRAEPDAHPSAAGEPAASRREPHAGSESAASPYEDAAPRAGSESVASPYESAAWHAGSEGAASPRESAAPPHAGGVPATPPHANPAQDGTTSAARRLRSAAAAALPADPEAPPARPVHVRSVRIAPAPRSGDTAPQEWLPLGRLALGSVDFAALAEEIGVEPELVPLAEAAAPGPGPADVMEPVGFDALMDRLVAELELEYLRMYGTGELGR